MKKFYRKQEAIWWLACVLLALVLVVVLARRLMGT